MNTHPSHPNIPESRTADDCLLTAVGIGKTYRTYENSWERFTDVARSLCGLNRRHGQLHRALQDVHLAVSGGESVAVIGPNGAGKSTLLRLVAGIGRPTNGNIERRGRFGTLLELDSGFHPSLDARQNARLCARMEGLHGNDLDNRVGRILELADVGALAGQPFRTWSRGMQLRLGFALAVTGSPDLLVVDEALAVGDERYRSRCIDHLDGLRRESTSLLFVSHDMAVVRRLADRVILLDRGHVVADGSPDQIVDAYLDTAHRGESTTFDSEGTLSWGDRRVTLHDVRCHAETDRTWTISAEFRATSIVAQPVFGVGISREDGTPVTAVNHAWTDTPLTVGPFRAGSHGRFQCRIGPLPLAPGGYRVSVHCYDHGGGRPLPLHHLEGAARIVIAGDIREGTGPVTPENRWTISLGTEPEDEK